MIDPLKLDAQRSSLSLPTLCIFCAFRPCACRNVAYPSSARHLPESRFWYLRGYHRLISRCTVLYPLLYHWTTVSGSARGLMARGTYSFAVNAASYLCHTLTANVYWSSPPPITNPFFITAAAMYIRVHLSSVSSLRNTIPLLFPLVLMWVCCPTPPQTGRQGRCHPADRRSVWIILAATRARFDLHQRALRSWGRGQGYGYGYSYGYFRRWFCSHLGVINRELNVDKRTGNIAYMTANGEYYASLWWQACMYTCTHSLVFDRR